VDIFEVKVRAAALPTENVVVLGSTLCCADYVLHRHTRDYHAIRRDAGWSAIEIILLDVNAVNGDVGDGDILVGDTAEKIIS
jgi:hypothetical protein